MDKKDPRLILWLWLGGIFLIVGIIGVAAKCNNMAAKDPLIPAQGGQMLAGVQGQGGAMSTSPMPLQGGVPIGTNTGALESTYNQIADVMNKITVSIYSTDPAQTQPQLVGSGVIISNQLILTNAHIVQTTGELSVAINGSQQPDYPVALFRCDAANDLALLQVTNNTSFQFTGILGNSDMVDRGDIVFAAGNAFGTGNLLANGMIVDNKFSYAVNGQQFTNRFRTNINIYPGSCGSPLVNIRSEVIGINNSAGSAQNNYMGIGYATPINSALALINSSKQTQVGTANGFIPVALNNGNPYVLT